jgi:hypothetical protein
MMIFKVIAFAKYHRYVKISLSVGASFGGEVLEPSARILGCYGSVQR